MQDAIVTTAWLAARAERLTIGSHVPCGAFRHSAALARQVVPLDHASGGVARWASVGSVLRPRWLRLPLTSLGRSRHLVAGRTLVVARSDRDSIGPRLRAWHHLPVARPPERRRARDRPRGAPR